MAIIVIDRNYFK